MPPPFGRRTFTLQWQGFGTDAKQDNQLAGAKTVTTVTATKQWPKRVHSRATA